jgi:hypothetical protein
MTKLTSGRVPKIPSANVRADRYEFLEISEAEPDLGLPSQLGQVFTSDLSGNRYWTRLDTANVSETTNLYFTADRAINALTGNNVTVNNLTVSGDLAVLGNLVSINTTTLNVEDRNILIANGAINSAQADNAGITIAGANAEIKYQNTGDKFDINKNVNIQGNLSIGGSIQAKDANSLLRNEINLDPNNGTYMSVRSEEINTFFNSSSWDTASWIDDGGGVAVITNATTLYTFWDTGVGSVVNNIEVSINGGSRIPVQFNSGNAVSGNVSLDLANGQPSGVPPTNPTAITSLNFFYRTKSSINIDYSGSEILLDAQSMDIDLRTTENLDLRSGQNLNIRSLGSYPVRIYTDDTTRMWEFDNTGSLTLPKEGKIYGIGQGSASDRYGYISWNGNSSGDGSGYNTMRLVPDQLGLEEADQYIIIDPTSGQPGHIHIRAGGTQDNSSANLFLGGENSYVMLGAGVNPPVTIAANNNSWIFSTDGTTSLPNDINVQGNVTIDGEFVGKGLTSNTIVANVITSNEWYGIYTANVVESSSSLYFTNARVISAVTPLLTTANVLELDNFYFTNVRTISAVSPLLTTANVTELNNLYYTNSRVIAAVTPLLTTSNVIEGTNLYYTDARVLANVEQMSVNVFADVDITGILNNGILVWNGTKFVAGTIDAGATSNLALFAEVANTVLTLNNFTTANLAEGTNLYFTNARSVGALTAGQNITIEANGRISANLTATLANITTVIDNLTTDSIAEGAINLYYTNSRVRSTLSGGTGVIYDSSAGSISIGQNVSTESSVVFKNLTLNGNLYVLGNLFSVFANTLTVSDPIIQIGYGNPSDSYDLGFVGHYNDGVERHTGLFRDHNDGKFKLFDNLIPEPGLINVDTSNVSFRYASLVVSTLEGNVTGTVGTLSNFTTANLKESTSNLYYTNDRVVTAVIPLLTTSNVIEGTNLYYTAERVNATVQPFLTTANVTETSGNLYFTNARVVSALIAGQNITIEANGRISANSTTASSLNLTTADVREVSSNLYYTDARVVTAVTPLLTTANVIEGTNQYFTNARSRSAFTPGKGIAITASGIITNTGASFEYNTGIDGSGYGNVLSTMSPIVIFPSTPTTDRFVLRSLHITNISDTDVSVSGNVLYATGNTAVIANRLPLPSGSSFELLEIPQVFQPNDIVNLQGFNTAGTATSNLLQAIYSYETFTGDITYKGQGITLATSNTDILVFESTLAFSIIESIKFVNLTSSVVPVKLYWADANNVIKAHFAHNLSLPSNSTLETIIKPKRISQGDRIFASYRNADSNSVSVFLSARTGYEYTPVSYSPNVIPSGTVSASFSSSESDGTLIYYTIE